jgi:ABC-type sugar transport system, permease component
MNKRSMSEIIFDIFNAIFMILIVLLTLYPMLYIFFASISDNTRLAASPGLLYKPLGFNLNAYKLAFKHPLLLTGYKNTLIILAVGVSINIAMTALCAYFMASKNVLFKKTIIAFMLFTMFFSGGLIPTFLNVKSLGLYNNLWALIIPGAISLTNAIITRTAIEAIPDSLIESAYIDGAQDFTILFKIIMPLIMPTTAVMILYYGVEHWNSWFSATIYIKNQKLYPIQVILRQILIDNNNALNANEVIGDKAEDYTMTMKFAVSMIVTLPILVVYPFLQKYFVKGAMIGAVKG